MAQALQQKVSDYDIESGSEDHSMVAAAPPVSKLQPKDSAQEEHLSKAGIGPNAGARCHRLGNPGPIGLLGFGMTTCMLMFLTTGWAEPAHEHMVMGYAMCFGGLTQWVAGVFEMIKGNTFPATAFMSYGAFWIGWWLLKIFTADGILSGSFTTGEALYFAQWSILTAAFFVMTLRRNMCLRVVFASLSLTYAMLAGSVFNDDVKKAAGYIGFFCGLSACYTAFAELFHEEYGVKLPGL